MADPLYHTIQFSKHHSIILENRINGLNGTVYRTDKKIADFVVNIPFVPWTIQTLPAPIRSQINLIIAESGSDSDDEYEITALDTIFIYKKEIFIPALSMTIPCLDKNIKGSTLIRLVHEQTLQWYAGVVEYACEYEKELGGAAISPPVVKNDILQINEPIDWFMSLGGWKGMMPQEEVSDYFFNTFTPMKRGTKFSGVHIFDKKILFPIHDGRIHIGKHFTIAQIDITRAWEKVGSKFIEIPQGKTDLSYSQILRAIETIKIKFGFNDSKIADIQLSALSCERDFPPEFKQDTHLEVLIFLNYLNGLMFGVEASGLNAALTTGLMTLELILKGHLTYEQAFKVNSDGGFYPYACFGNNQGTYSKREQVLTENPNSDAPSMKSYRNGKKFSPVANKEAILIKEWLVRNKLITKEITYDEQLANIKKAIENLITEYFAPWCA